MVEEPARPAPAAAGSDDDAGDRPGGRRPGTGRRPSRRTFALVAVPLVVLVVASNVGDAAMPTLVDSHPAWFIALNARNRNLVLVTNNLDAWSYYGIGTVRLLVSDPLFFLLGYWYGDAAVEWMERRTRTWGQMLRQVEQFFGKAAYPLIFVAPNNPICLFAGAAGMPVRAFLAVNLAGTVTRLYLIRRFGEAFESPIDDVVGWIGDYRVPLLVLSIGLVVLSVALEAKRGETQVESLVHLEDELDEIDAELARKSAGDQAGAGGSDEPGDPDGTDDGDRRDGDGRDGDGSPGRPQDQP
jgi:membrane protein DedA with SNARE-associated domain